VERDGKNDIEYQIHWSMPVLGDSPTVSTIVRPPNPMKLVT
jgi:hypothetical protein